MTAFLYTFILPAAFALLPPAMGSKEAEAMLLAIALQESKAKHRRQLAGGPARGFWQFEQNGITGVLIHARSHQPLMAALDGLRYPLATPYGLYLAVEHNDVLACIFARLLLWTLPAALPGRTEPDKAWHQYMLTWRPGKPHADTWAENFAKAWEAVDLGGET